MARLIVFIYEVFTVVPTGMSNKRFRLLLVWHCTVQVNNTIEFFLILFYLIVFGVLSLKIIIKCFYHPPISYSLITEIRKVVCLLNETELQNFLDCMRLDLKKNNALTM